MSTNVLGLLFLSPHHVAALTRTSSTLKHPMAHITPFMESDFDSIHSSQAFIGDHQVMYTPPLRAKKPSRFASTQSYILPDIPNTSQIVGGGAGELPKMRHSTNENQIVNALTRMQKQLDQARTTIRELMRERDEYRGEAKVLRQILAQTQRSTGHKSIKSKAVEDIDNDLLDFTQYSEANDDFTQRLPTLNVAKTKSNMKPAPERAQTHELMQHKQIISNDVPTPRALQRHSSRLKPNQPLDAKRRPLREISESQYQQASQASPQKAGKKVVIEDDYSRGAYQNNTVETNARAHTRNITYLSNIPDNQPFTTLRNQLEAERLNRQLRTTKAVNSKQQDTARFVRAATAPPLQHEPIAILEDREFTATSNTSRRRRRASDTGEIDEGMTSAYLLPDITIAKPQPQPQPQPQEPSQASLSATPPSEQLQPGVLSEDAKNFLHSVDPDHIVTCIHCRRLLRLPEKLQVRKEAAGWDWCMVLGDK
jgi:hypothetical protein